MSVITFSDFQSKYRFNCQLSQGSFGRVCKIEEIKTKKYFALKKITVKKKQQLEDVEHQIELLKRFRHPFIVQIIETYNIQIQNGFAKPILEVGIILELAKCSLQQIIRMRKNPGTFQFVTEQVIGLIKILFFLQKQNIVHRDIKPANILVFETPDNTSQWKLADFGLALDLSRNGETENFAGSFQYASPKLKRKFKYSNLKIKTNPFKDDVYSLGVTLLQTITGYRTYNNIAYERLRQVCTERKLIQMVDMMLQQDQQKRPCFKQLMMLIQKDFPQQNKPLKQKPWKQEQALEKPQMSQPHITDRTVLKPVPQAPRYTNLLPTKKSLQCVALTNSTLMCGCDNGQIIFIINNTVVQCGKVHARYVTQLVNDSQGHVWSVGGDCIIRRWDTRGIGSGVREINRVDDGFLGKDKHTVAYVVQNVSKYYQEIQLPFFYHCGISALYVQDQNNFVAGFYNGYVYARWNGKQFNCKIFTKPATAIKSTAKNEKLWMCSLDGQVKYLQTQNLTLANRFFYSNNASFVGLYTHEMEGKLSLTLITLDGRHMILNKDLQCIFENVIAKNHILSSIEKGDNCYVLMENGEIMDLNEEKIVQFGGRGWNCIASGANNQLIVGSFQGQVGIVEL